MNTALDELSMLYYFFLVIVDTRSVSKFSPISLYGYFENGKRLYH